MPILKTSTPPLNERIAALQAEIETLIDLRVKEAKEGKDGASPCEGIPEAVIRAILTNRSDGCLCRAYKNLTESEI